MAGVAVSRRLIGRSACSVAWGLPVIATGEDRVFERMNCATRAEVATIMTPLSPVPTRRERFPSVVHSARSLPHPSVSLRAGKPPAVPHRPLEKKMVIPATELDASVRKPHVVLLGAGASLACLPNGDRNGVRLPLMNNLIDLVGLRELLGPHALEENFEVAYEKLFDDGDARALSKVNSTIFEYFDRLRLPDEPTLYDYLMLCLREKDVIFTFNWDPLLCQAYARNKLALKRPPPSMFFLHGNVANGPCTKCGSVGRPGQRCPKCNSEATFGRMPLLYPIGKKDYQDELISTEWAAAKEALREAWALNIYGYGAPVSDVEAKALLCENWTANPLYEMAEVEIIDIAPDEVLDERWDPLVFASHRCIAKEFFASSLGLYPRRSGEALDKRLFQGEWVQPCPPPRPATLGSLSDLQNWFQPLIDAEAARA
jgi:hypothetical protein